MASLLDGVTPSRVVLRIPAHSIGTKASSVHLSFVTSRWGHPMGRVWFSSYSIETKFSLDNWSVFLQDGVTLFGSDSNDLISIEGITSVGLLGVFFWAVLGMFCHPVVVRLALKSRGGGGGGGEVSTFSCLHFWCGLCVYPSHQRRSGSWPCCLSPSPRGSVCFGSLSVFLSPGRFHAPVFRAWWLASDSSGGRTSREGVLGCIQGASDSLRHLSPGGETETSVFGVAVRVLLRATSLSHGMVSSPRRAEDCPPLP